MDTRPALVTVRPKLRQLLVVRQSSGDHLVGMDDVDMPSQIGELLVPAQEVHPVAAALVVSIDVQVPCSGSHVRREGFGWWGPAPVVVRVDVASQVEPAGERGLRLNFTRLGIC